MALNLDAVGEVVEADGRAWTSTDALLYALGVGAGVADPAKELEFTTENSQDVPQKVLPTFAVMIASREARQSLGDFHLSKILHAEQSVTLHSTLQPDGHVKTAARIVEFQDKGKDALAVSESEMTDADTGAPVATTRSVIFIRGEGGFGGERGTSREWAEPTGEPDVVVTYPTRRDQPLLYRLSGDRNPLHSDPAFAARAGFDGPIMHGLCVYGMAGRAVLHELCDSDPDRFGSFAVRFASPTMPGDELTVKMWRNDDGAAFRAYVGDRVVLDRGTFTYR